LGRNINHFEKKGNCFGYGRCIVENYFHPAICTCEYIPQSNLDSSTRYLFWIQLCKIDKRKKNKVFISLCFSHVLNKTIISIYFEFYSLILINIIKNIMRESQSYLFECSSPLFPCYLLMRIIHMDHGSDSLFYTHYIPVYVQDRKIIHLFLF
jgi:hypothetical protein